MADSNGLVASAREEYSERWYSKDLPELSPGTREVLEQYSKIPSDQIESHIRDIRDKAWAVHSYPCIGQWRFLDLSVGMHKLYPEIVNRMRTGEQIYLDLGCAFAQDIRRLVADGVDSSLCYGSDLQLDFIDLGYQLFQDRDTLQSKFIAANIFDTDSSLTGLGGKVDIIGASSFFHLFSWNDQKIIAKRVSKLLKPRKDSLIIGRQVGAEVAGEKVRRTGSGSRYRHTAESWQKMWREIGEEIGVDYEVQAATRPVQRSYDAEFAVGMEFSVRRL